jgi:hypothetical protein
VSVGSGCARGIFVVLRKVKARTCAARLRYGFVNL